MSLSFTRNLDREALATAVDRIIPLVGSPEVATSWQRESALAGMTVGGLTRHLVSQPECAVEFLRIPVPEDADVITLTDYYDRVDWLTADVDAPENSSIREEFNAMAAAGPQDSVAILTVARAHLVAAVDGAGPGTYVPWQDCVVATDDFLVSRLIEVVVHADDLAASVGVPTPRFDHDALDPVVATLAALSVRRHGAERVLRSLARTERAEGGISAF